jgi:hypothetical protein
MGGDVGQFWLYFNEEVSLKPGAFQRGEGSRAEYFEPARTSEQKT